MTDRDSIAAWLRRIAPTLMGDQETAALHFADQIERYADRARPLPTIPASEWMGRSNVG